MNTNRRCFLRGLGGTVTLPFLDSLSSAEPNQISARTRFLVVGNPFGMHPQHFFPSDFGKDFTIPPTLKSLSWLKDRLTILSHTDHNMVSGHGREISFLSGVLPSDARAFPEKNMSLDQVLARHVGSKVRFPSVGAALDSGIRMSWTANGVEKLPITDPHQLFDHLFMNLTPRQKEQRRRMLGRDKSILDTVLDQCATLVRDGSKADCDRIDQFQTSIRELEQSLADRETWLDYDKPSFDISDHFVGESTITKKYDAIFDMIAYAFETDLTRVASVEFPSELNYRDIHGVNRSYHGCTHNGRGEDLVSELVSIESFQIARLARCLKKLDSIQEPMSEGSMLDHTIVLFGSGMGYGGTHSNRNLPILVAGGGFKHLGHFDARDGSGNNMPLCNLFVTLMQRFGLEREAFQHEYWIFGYGSGLEMSVVKLHVKMRSFTNFSRQIAHTSFLHEMTFCVIGGILLSLLNMSIAAETLVETHCAACHSGEGSEGNFRTAHLGSNASKRNIDFWKLGLERIEAGEMPPAEENQLTSEERQQLISFFHKRIYEYFTRNENTLSNPPRRLNNREFKNSVRDVLGIEDAGTHQPTDNLIGDSRHDGFDTHGTTLGFSHFHLEQYLDTLRRIVDATILSGEKPDLHFYEISPSEILSAHTSQNTTRPERRGDPSGFDFLDPKQLAYFKSLPVIPETGWYDIAIDCIGLDRGLYKSEKTGVYEGDPIRLTIVMGDREQTFDLSDDQITEIRTTQWLAKGTRLRLKYQTDGLTLRGNGNFKFQYAIAGEYIKQNDPILYREVADAIKTKPNRRVLKPESWHHWVDYWQGPRPRILKASINGPYYDSWPPARQTALLGVNPRVENVKDILKPIAERAWRRKFSDSELSQITNLVRSCQDDLGETEAFKEGIVAILASPAFLLVNSKDLDSEERFTEKLSLFLQSTIPDDALSDSVSSGKFETFDEIYKELKRRFTQSRCDPFLKEFPYAWLELNKINFMSPDPDHYRHYHRKRVSDDMVNEVLTFFHHIVSLNLPVTDLIFADYSFVNADLATIYNLNNIPPDSRLRKYTWTDGRRGGFLGMGAFLTLTADSLGTSPIHRAVYIMEKLLGIHPTPPPADVLIKEPDIRSAKTIRDVLEAHKSDQTCAACHQRIDPYGWAFENFGPNGGWRDFYSEGAANSNLSKHTKQKEIRIDASANFQNGIEYRDILDFRNHLKTKVNRDRFVRCFITKLLTYANGEEPKNFLEIEKIVQKSASYDHRIVATIAAVIDSPLFRENR